MRTKTHRLLYGFLSLLLFAACNSNEIYESTVKFDGNEWPKDSVVCFSAAIADTNSAYDISLAITNSDGYPYANLYLFTDIVFPSRQYLRDTVEFVLSTNDGQWLGSGAFGYTNTFIFKTNVKFPEAGQYKFLFEQAMRCTNADCSVEGIEKITLSISKKQ